MRQLARSSPPPGARVGTPQEELREYLGGRFDESEAALVRDWNAAPRDTPEQIEAFYRQTRSYLYDLTRWHQSCRYPYAAVVASFARHHRLKHILEFGCGIGTDGLQLIERGFDVSFYDFRNASTEYLQWRLNRRGWTARIFFAGEDELPNNDLTFAMDVLEHVVDPAATLAQIGQHTRSVAFNLPVFPQNDKYPMHFKVDRRAARTVLRQRGFRPVYHFSALRYPRALALFWEGPQFWMK